MENRTELKAENEVNRKEAKELTVYIKIKKSKNQILKQNHKSFTEFYNTLSPF